MTKLPPSVSHPYGRAVESSSFVSLKKPDEKQYCGNIAANCSRVSRPSYFLSSSSMVSTTVS
jgi:hypothetical protein